MTTPATPNMEKAADGVRDREARRELSDGERKAMAAASRRVRPSPEPFEGGWRAARDFYAGQSETFAAGQKMAWDAMRERAERAEAQLAEARQVLRDVLSYPRWLSIGGENNTIELHLARLLYDKARSISDAKKPAS